MNITLNTYSENEEFNNYYLASICILGSVLILFGTHSSIFSYAALAFFALASVYSKNIYIVNLLIFIYPMATIFKPSSHSSSFFTYLELLVVLIFIFRKRFSITKRELGAIFFICYLILLQMLCTGTFEINRTLKLGTNILLICLFAEMELFSQYKRVYLSFIWGCIVSSSFTFLNSSFFRIAEYTSAKTENMITTVVVRFSGLYDDPNYYVLNIIIAICLVNLLFVYKEISFGYYVFLCAFLIYFAGLTGSKSALFMLAIPFIIGVILLLKNGEYLYFCLLLFIIGILIVAIMAGKLSIFNTAFLRISNSGKDMGSLTTGRSQFWINYLHYFRDNILRLPFGNSILSFTLDGAAAHNTYIDLIYQLGVVGTTWLVLMLYGCFTRVSDWFLKNIANYSVLLIVLIMYFFLSELQYYDMPFHLIIAITAFNVNYRDSNSVFSDY